MTMAGLGLKSRGAKWVGVALLASASGCIPGGVISGVGRPSVPIAPGDTPFVMIRCINASGLFAIDFLIQTESTTTSGTTTGGGNLLNVRSNGGDSGLLVACPVDKIALGNVNDPDSTGFRVGIPGQEKIEVSWGADGPLVAGFSYNCGDTVIFLATDDQNSPGGILISTGLIGGASETGPFQGPDTFENLEALLRSEGLLTN